MKKGIVIATLSAKGVLIAAINLLAGTARLVKNPIQFSIGNEEAPFSIIDLNVTITFHGTQMRVAGIIVEAIETVG